MDGIAYLSPDLQRAFSAAVQAEKKPIQTIANNKAKVDARVNLTTDVLKKVDDVKSSLSGLDTVFGIRDLAVGSSDLNAVIGTADKKLAMPGTHSFEVLQLASSASAVSNGFPDKNETNFGTGFFSFTTAAGDTKEFFIDAENATLEGIATVLNGARLGLKASVVNDQTDPENPYRLVLVADGTGSLNSVEYPEFHFMDGEEEFYIEHERPAQNAIVHYEGIEIQAPSNEVPDLIPGVTVNLKGITEPGKPASLTISQDIPKTTEKVKGLVDKLNGVFSFIQQQNKMDEKTDTSTTLGGEYSLRVTEQRLRSTLTQGRLFEEGRAIRTMGDIGIQFTKEGTLKFDDKKFETALNANFDEVVSFLTGEEGKPGVFSALGRTLTTISGPGAVLTSFKQSETDKANRMGKDIEKKEKNADQKAEELKMKLSRMQTAITSMQRQSQSMASSSGTLEGQLLGQ